MYHCFILKLLLLYLRTGEENAMCTFSPFFHARAKCLRAFGPIGVGRCFVSSLYCSSLTRILCCVMLPHEPWWLPLHGIMVNKQAASVAAALADQAAPALTTQSSFDESISWNWTTSKLKTDLRRIANVNDGEC